MRMTGKFVLLLVAMLALFLGQARAQRCLPGMKGVQLMADMVDGFYCGKECNDTGFAFGLAVSTYAKGGNKWVSGIEIMRRYYPYRNTFGAVYCGRRLFLQFLFRPGEKCIFEYWCFGIDGV